MARQCSLPRTPPGICAASIDRDGWIDFNTGVIADGEKTIDEAAKDLLDLVIRVASGEQTKAEKHGFREISIFKDGVVL